MKALLHYFGTKQLVFSLLLLVFGNLASAQTNPAPHDLTNTFSFTGFAAGTTTVYPTSMQGHSFAAEVTASGSGTADLHNTGTLDSPLVASTASATSGSIRNEIGSGISLLKSGTTVHIGALVVALNTTNRTSVKVTFTAAQLTAPAAGATDRINAVRLQYRIGTTGSFTDVASTDYLGSNTLVLNAAQTFTNIALPATCDNQAIVHVRWVYYISSGTANGRDRISLDEISITSSPAAAAPAITVTGTPLANFGTVVVNSFSTSQTLTVDAVNLTTNVTVTAPSTDFQVSADNTSFGATAIIPHTAGTITALPLYVRFSPQTSGAKSGNVAFTSTLATTVNVAAAGTGQPLNSNASDIIADVAFITPTNIAYQTYQAADITDLNSIEVGGFTIADGGALPDADALKTQVTDLTFSVSNFANIRKLALYDGTTELSEVAVTTGSVTFSGLMIEAADDATKSIRLRATYNSAVIDNQQTVYAITAATANPLFSTFAATNAGGASTTAASGDNKISVVATSMVYTTQPTATNINASITPSVKLKLVDALGNLDLNYVEPVVITSSGALVGTPVSATADVFGIVTFATLAHSALQNGVVLTATSVALTATSNTFDINKSIFSNTIVATNPSASNPFTTGQVVDPLLTVSGIGRGIGIVAASATDRYNANTWNVATFDATKYFEFVLTPTAGNQIDFKSFIYTSQKSSTGPTAVMMRSSIDNFTADIGLLSASTTATTATVDLFAPAYQQVTSAITFRIYAFGASSPTATFSINDFIFNGNVGVSTVPSVSTSVASLTGLDYLVGPNPSSVQSFTVSGANLSPANGALSITPSTIDFEVSTDNITFAATATLPYSAATLTNVAVYVRLKAGLVANVYNTEIGITGSSAPGISVTAQGTVRTPFGIPYHNTLGTANDINTAIGQGFSISSATSAVGYLNIAQGGSISTPIINFSTLKTIEIDFMASTFGGNNGQIFELQVSTDGGSTYTIVGAPHAINVVGGTYLSFREPIDLTVAPFSTTNEGKFRIKLSGGTNSARLKELRFIRVTKWTGEWSNGEPDIEIIANFDADYTALTDVFAKRVKVISGNIIFTSGTTLHLDEEIKVVGGTVFFENNANLMQISNDANSGNITFERNASLKRLDYAYWSSPVTGQNLGAFSPLTLTNRFYTLNEPTNAFVWIDPALNTFSTAKGYMIRAPNTFLVTPSTFGGLFTGVPFNGNYSATVSQVGLGYNLIGNPYPSPILISQFFVSNPTIGTIYFWAHVTLGAGVNNYATYNGSGFAAPAGGAIPNGKIQIGQGFVVNAPSPTTAVLFNNAMRIDDHSNQFFRNATTTEKHRVWLNLENETATLNQILIAYVEGATNDVDVQFDGKMIENSGSLLYNILDNEAYTIQGKALPFLTSDVVKLGFKASTDGTYTITVDHVDGVFADTQNVYLKDNLTGIVHDIKANSYSFAAVAGNDTTRFELVYENVLATENPNFDNNSLIVFNQNGVVNLNSGGKTMQSVKIFDLRGRLLFENNKLQSSTFAISDLKIEHQLLVVQVSLADQTLISKKIRY